LNSPYIAHTYWNINYSYTVIESKIENRNIARSNTPKSNFSR